MTSVRHSQPSTAPCAPIARWPDWRPASLTLRSWTVRPSIVPNNAADGHLGTGPGAGLWGRAHPSAAASDLPPLPPPQTQRAVERHLAAFWFWLEAGRIARERHQQRHPHALPSLSRLARLLDLALEFKKLALAGFSQSVAEKITYDYNLTDLKRAYGHRDGPLSSTDTASGPAAASPGPCSSGCKSAPASALSLDPKPPPPARPPTETKRDITPVKLVRGPHGFLMYEYPKPPSGS